MTSIASRCTRLPLLLLVALLMASPAQAQLHWPKRAIELKAQPGQSVVETRFAFTNTGEQPVTITDVQASCGCTTAQLTQTTYAPGEAGAIAVRFEPGARQGEQVKTILVRTDHPDQPLARLRLTVQMPTLVQLEPRLVHWRGDERGMREVEVRLPEPAQVDKLTLGKVPKGLKAELIPLPAKEPAPEGSAQATATPAATQPTEPEPTPQRYQLQLTPKADMDLERGRSQLVLIATLATESAEGQEQVQRRYPLKLYRLPGPATTASPD